MPGPARRTATYEDLLRVPEGMIAEILAGELVTQPRPGPRHASVSSVLGHDLGGPFHRGRGGPGGWWILDEPEIHLGADVLVPDLAGWHRERMPHLPEAAAFELAPDWVAEVLSPGTARRDRLVKMSIYAREGVAHVWLLDPAVGTLEVFRLEGVRWLLLGTHGADETVRTQPFEAVALDLAGVFER